MFAEHLHFRHILMHLQFTVVDVSVSNIMEGSSKHYRGLLNPDDSSGHNHSLWCCITATVKYLVSRGGPLKPMKNEYCFCTAVMFNGRQIKNEFM